VERSSGNDPPAMSVEGAASSLLCTVAAGAAALSPETRRSTAAAAAIDGGAMPGDTAGDGADLLQAFLASIGHRDPATIAAYRAVVTRFPAWLAKQPLIA
jgi:hypothetical protein